MLLEIVRISTPTEDSVDAFAQIKNEECTSCCRYTLWLQNSKGCWKGCGLFENNLEI